MSFVEGYDNLEKLYESVNSLVFRGIRAEDQEKVVLKLLKHDFPTPGELSRYRQEYEITQNLRGDGIITAHDLRKHQKTLLIVLEDFGGQSLKGVEKMPVDEFLDVAIKVVRALGEVHAQNVIHKDINPSNIVVNRETGEVKLIDFGISTRFTSESPMVQSPDVLEGTLLYMSPEQTGRMNRSLDHRTDFYSLGATFHHLLTGQPPFDNDDPMELVHAHIAREPTPLHEVDPAIPRALSAIVGKLLAKKAEERYQSARGLLTDLEAVQAGKAGDDFVPGFSDHIERFQIPEKLYGREHEIETVLAAFERVHGGASELLTVAGYSGIGKTALIQEVYKPMTAARGFFIAGKFDQLQRNIPFSALVSAFNDLVRQLLTESEQSLAQWRDRLNAALAPNAQVLVDVVPEIELILGPQPAVPEMGPSETVNRFNVVVQSFVRALCSAEHPLVIFLDDLQWADSATLNLIELVMTDEETQHLFLIGAYRDNEVDPVHPLVLTLKKIRDEGGAMGEITLAPLGLQDLTALVSDTLQRPLADVVPLAELVIAKTQGNPLFAGQFLKMLHQEGLLTRGTAVSGESQWVWDVERIQAAGITDNVVDLLIGKLRRLSDDTQDALRLAACIGNRFDLDTLAIIRGKSPQQTFSVLVPAIQEELVRPTTNLAASDVEDVMSALMVSECRFQHDRVQQAAYALFDESARAQVHLEIGRRLLADIDADELAERVFEVIDHLNMGRELITDADERFRLAELNLEAGKKAASATAHGAALKYLRIARSLLPEDAWTGHYAFTMDLNRTLTESEYLNAHYEEWEALAELSLEHAANDVDKAQIYGDRIVQFTIQGRFAEAIESGVQCFRLLDIHLDLDDLDDLGGAQLGRAAELLEGRDIASLVDLPDLKDRRVRLAQQAVPHLTIAAFLANQSLFPFVTALGLNLSLEYGNCPESALTYANYGLIIGAFMGRYRDGYEFGKVALEVCDRFHGSAPTATVCLVMGSELIPWVEHIRASNAVLERGYKEGLETGDYLWAGYVIMYKVIVEAFAGRNIQELLEETQARIHFTNRTQNVGASHGMMAHQIMLSALAGVTPDDALFDVEGLTEATFVETCKSYGLGMSQCFHSVLKAEVLFMLGRPAEALQYTQDIEPSLAYIVNHPNLADHKLYQALSAAALYTDADEDRQTELMALMKAGHEQLTVWAKECAENYLHKQLMVEAEIARLEGQGAVAIDAYERAIESAASGEFPQDEALANELAARYWQARRPGSNIADMYLRNARYAYRLWGAHRKVQRLEEEFPQLTATVATGSPHRDVTMMTMGTITTRRAHGGVLDLGTVLKASETLAREVVLAELLERLIGILMENAGAERGVLVLSRGDKLHIEADGNVESVSVMMGLSLDGQEGSQRLPLGVINFAARTRQPVVVDDATSDERFLNDPYVRARSTRSILCQPILNQGRLVGLVYLENDLTPAAFTPQRIELLNLLSSQIAISIENAELVENLEDKVRERTEQLEVRNRFIRQTFGRYLSDQVVDSLLESEEGLALGGEKRSVTIMMSDLRGFTSLSESLPPETVVSIINNYLSVMTEVILEYGGTIDEFIGDAILVIFGAPFKMEDDAERAVACALEMQQAMGQVNAWNRERGLPDLEMGIGINTGEVVVGNIGSTARAKYGVVGSNVNLAGRIESYTVGGQVLIPQSTKDAIDLPLRIDGQMTVEPKGVAKPIQIYEVGGIGGKYGLDLASTAVQPVEVGEVPICFRILQDKDVAGDEVGGVIVRLSPTEAEIRASVEVNPLANVRMNLVDDSGGKQGDEIYGKVMGRETDAGHFQVRFTSVPTSTRAQLEAIVSSRAGDAPKG